MKRTFTVICLALMSALSARPASAQSQPADTYTFTGLKAGALTTLFGDYKIDDFLFSFENITSANETIDTEMDTTSNFTWADCSYTGTYYDYDSVSLPSGGSTYALNVIGLSVLANVDDYFNGSLTATEEGNHDFYIGPPSIMAVETPSWDSNMCTAYFDAWEAGSATPPWFYDPTYVLLVSPYANEWHNDELWYTGWGTGVSITNIGSSSTTYTINYLSDGGVPKQRDPTNSNCSSAASSLDQSLVTPSIAGNGTYTGTLDDIFAQTAGYHVDDSNHYQIAEDGAFTLSLSPFVGVTSPSSSITAYGSGTADPYCMNDCTVGSGVKGLPLVTTCY